MDKFTSGKKNAKYYYKPFRHFVIGIVFGFNLGLIDTHKEGGGFFNNPNGTISLVTPLFSTILYKNQKHKVVSISSMTDK